MRRKIYTSLLVMGFACMIITNLIAGWFFLRTMENQVSEEMEIVANVVKAAIVSNDKPEQALQEIAKEDTRNIRITWVNNDGSVRFDSEMGNTQLDNHLNRPEIQEALTDGEGSSVRSSQTLSRTMYYKAEKLPNGTVVRISMERDSMFAHFLSILPMMLLLFALAAIGCIKMSRRLTASLLAPLHQTILLIKKIGDIGTPIPKTIPSVDSELQPLVDKIVDQSRVIDQTIHSLEQQRNVVKLMMENLQEGVVLTDGDYHVLGINECAVHIFNQQDRTKIMGKSLRHVFTAANWAEIQEAQHSEKAMDQRLTIDGRTYLLTVQPVYKVTSFYGILFIIDDITEQERQEQLRREFTSNVSHELKTPLTSISGFAEVLATGLAKNQEDVMHFSGLIRKEAKRLLSMIEEIMHLTHIEEGKRQTVREPVYLKTIIDDIIEFMEPVLIEKKVTVHCMMENVAFEGDQGLIREVAMNLIDNAVKYNRPGGHVYIRVQQVDQEVELSVRDTGIGIPEDKQKRVFERFYRADSSRSQKIGGSGLGLSIVKHIVEHHHGRISLKSKENEGTEITVHFPI